MKTDFYFDATILPNLSSTGRWRSKQAVRFPSDPRNAKAAAELARLAESTFDRVEPELWARLAPHLGTDALADAVNETSRAVGFRFKPTTINDVLTHTLAELGAAQ